LSFARYRPMAWMYPCQKTHSARMLYRRIMA